MKTLSKEAEDLILDSIQDVCQHVTEGSSPTDAVIKVAEDRELNPNFIRLVCTGYNTGATAFQREKSAKILDKMAEFPLADVTEVLGSLYPEKPVTANILKEASQVDTAYGRAPRIGTDSKTDRRGNEKAASAGRASGSVHGSATATKAASQAGGHRTDNGPVRTVLGEPVRLPSEERMKHAYNESLQLKRQLEIKRADYAKSQDDLVSTLSALAESIKLGEAKLADVQYAAETYFGDAGRAIGEYLRLRVPSSVGRTNKTASVGGVQPPTNINWERGAYLLLKRAHDVARRVTVLRGEFRDLESATQDKVAEVLSPFEVAQSHTEPKKVDVMSSPTSTDSLNKQAAGFLGGLLGGQMMRSLGTSLAQPKPTGDLSAGMAQDLDDPDHENELRKIQTRTMLQDLMMNDEVISGYDPSEILDSYNEIVSVTPRSATQAAIIRPLLRKRLTQGAIEPFEAAEMVNIEKNIGQAQQPAHSFEDQPVRKQGSIDVTRHNILG
jgi:hypothetical protein